MTNKELESLAVETYEKSLNVMRPKNADYTCGNSEKDALYNFYCISDATGMSPFMVWAVYFLKHCLAVVKYAKSGFVESEGIEGRIHDIINYSVLLLALIRDKKGKNDNV